MSFLSDIPGFGEARPKAKAASSAFLSDIPGFGPTPPEDTTVYPEAEQVSTPSYDPGDIVPTAYRDARPEDRGAFFSEVGANLAALPEQIGSAVTRFRGLANVNSAQGAGSAFRDTDGNLLSAEDVEVADPERYARGLDLLNQADAQAQAAARTIQANQAPTPPDYDSMTQEERERFYPWFSTSKRLGSGVGSSLPSLAGAAIGGVFGGVPGAIMGTLSSSPVTFATIQANQSAELDDILKRNGVSIDPVEKSKLLTLSAGFQTALEKGGDVLGLALASPAGAKLIQKVGLPNASKILTEMAESSVRAERMLAAGVRGGFGGAGTEPLEEGLQQAASNVTTTAAGVPTPIMEGVGEAAKSAVDVGFLLGAAGGGATGVKTPDAVRIREQVEALRKRAEEIKATQQEEEVRNTARAAAGLDRLPMLTGESTTPVTGSTTTDSSIEDIANLYTQKGRLTRTSEDGTTTPTSEFGKAVAEEVAAERAVTEQAGTVADLPEGRDVQFLRRRLALINRQIAAAPDSGTAAGLVRDREFIEGQIADRVADLVQATPAGSTQGPTRYSRPLTGTQVIPDSETAQGPTLEQQAATEAELRRNRLAAEERATDERVDQLTSSTATQIGNVPLTPVDLVEAAPLVGERRVALEREFQADKQPTVDTMTPLLATTEASIEAVREDIFKPLDPTPRVVTPSPQAAPQAVVQPETFGRRAQQEELRDEVGLLRAQRDAVNAELASPVLSNSQSLIALERRRELNNRRDFLDQRIKFFEDTLERSVALGPKADPAGAAARQVEQEQAAAEQVERSFDIRLEEENRRNSRFTAEQQRRDATIAELRAAQPDLVQPAVAAEAPTGGTVTPAATTEPTTQPKPKSRIEIVNTFRKRATNFRREGLAALSNERRIPGDGPLTPNSVKTIIDRLVPPQLRGVVNSYTSLDAITDPDVRAEFENEPEAIGYFSNGQVHIAEFRVGDNATYAGALIHELKGHVATEVLLGSESDEYFERVFNDLADNPEFFSVLSTYAKSATETYNVTTPRGRANIGREFAADLAERAPTSNAFAKVYFTFKRILRRMGFNAKWLNITKAELADMLVRADIALSRVRDTSKLKDRLALFVPPEDIEEAMDSFVGADGAWRIEVDDSVASVNKDVLFSDKTKTLPLFGTFPDSTTTLGEVLDHPEFFRRFPAAASVPVYITYGDGASFTTPSDAVPTGFIAVGIDNTNFTDQQIKSTILHEAQHFIQDASDFAPGASVSQFTPTLERGTEALPYDVLPSPIAEFVAKVNSDISASGLDAANLFKQAATPFVTTNDLFWLLSSPTVRSNAEMVTALETVIERRNAAGFPMTRQDLLMMQASNIDAYRNALGEVEAQDVQDRASLSAEERATTPPNTSGKTRLPSAKREVAKRIAGLAKKATPVTPAKEILDKLGIDTRYRGNTRTAKEEVALRASKVPAVTDARSMWKNVQNQLYNSHAIVNDLMKSLGVKLKDNIALNTEKARSRMQTRYIRERGQYIEAYDTFIRDNKINRDNAQMHSMFTYALELNARSRDAVGAAKLVQAEFDKTDSKLPDSRRTALARTAVADRLGISRKELADKLAFAEKVRYIENASGVDDAKAKAGLDLLNQENPQYAEATAMLQAAAKRTITILYEGGVISKEEYDKLMEVKGYVPLQGFAGANREISDDLLYPSIKKSNVIGQGMSGGLNVDSSGIRGMEGRVTLPDFTRIRANIDNQLVNAIVSSENNEALKSLIKVVHENPMPSYWQIYGPGQEISDERKPNTIGIRIGGKQFHVWIAEGAMVTAIQAANPFVNNPIFNITGQLTRWLSTMNTAKSLGFLAFNPIRDISGAFFSVKLFKEIPDAERGDVIKKFKEYTNGLSPESWKQLRALSRALNGKYDMGEYSEWAKRFQDSGAISDILVPRSIEEIQKDFEKDETSLGQFVNASRAVNNAVSHVNEVAENYTRLALFKAVEEVRAANPNSEMTEETAVYMARNAAPNYSRRGQFIRDWGLHKLYAFFPATLRGQAVIWKQLRDNPKKAAEYAGYMMAAGFAYTALGYAMGDEDEEGLNYYDKLPAYRKYGFINIAIPGTKDSVFTLPLPHMWSIPFGFGAWLAEATFSKRNNAKEEAATQFAGHVGQSLWPLGGYVGAKNAEDVMFSVMHNLAPTPARYGVEIAMNRDWTGRKIWNDKMPNDTSPFYLNADPGRQGLVSKISELMNDATGGSEYVAGWADVPPQAIQHFIGFVLGGQGRDLNRVEDMLRRQGSRDFNTEMERAVDIASGVPLISRFFSTGADDKFYAQNYSTIRDVVQEKGMIRERALKAGDTETAKAILNDNPLEVVTMAPRIKEAEKQLKALRETTKELRTKMRMGNIEPEDYNRKIEELRVKSNNIRSKAVKAYFAKVSAANGY